MGRGEDLIHRAVVEFQTSPLIILVLCSLPLVLYFLVYLIVAVSSDNFQVLESRRFIWL